MDTTKPNKTPMQAKPLAELLPAIRAILSEDAIRSLTAQKQPKSTIHQTKSTEKILKPMTFAELQALNGVRKENSPRRFPQPSASKVRPWNSSVKVNKTRTVTTDSQKKPTTARKMLSFQQKLRPTAVNNTPLTSSAANKRTQTNTHLRDRISGVCKIPETPFTKKPIPIRSLHGEIKNMSIESNCDHSFLQREKEINDFEAKSNALTEETTCEKIADVSPPVSTPFKEYRDIRDYFNDDTDNSLSSTNNNTIAADKHKEIKDNNQREESVIVSLCEMLNKATVTNANNDNNRIQNGDLLEDIRQTENTVKMIDNVLEMLNVIKEKELKLLHSLREKVQTDIRNKNNATIIPPKIVVIPVKDGENISEKSPMIGTKQSKVESPSYKIPRKRSSFRKSLFHKSIQNNDRKKTPNKNTDMALKAYMQIKDQMTFLNTPLAKHRNIENPDTPAVTSRNLQKQLDKLYNES